MWIGSGTEKRLQVFKVKIAVDDVNDDKEPMFSGKSGSGGLPQFAQVVAYGMKRKCDQIQSHQCVRQSLFAVADVMLHMIAVFFQQVKPFVFNLPARTQCQFFATHKPSLNIIHSIASRLRHPVDRLV